MGQNESRSTTTTTAVTPVVTPSKTRFLAVVHHPPSSEMSNDLNNKTCNTTTKFLGMYANLIIFFIFQITHKQLHIHNKLPFGFTISLNSYFDIDFAVDNMLEKNFL